MCQQLNRLKRLFTLKLVVRINLFRYNLEMIKKNNALFCNTSKGDYCTYSVSRRDYSFICFILFLIPKFK